MVDLRVTFQYGAISSQIEETVPNKEIRHAHMEDIPRLRDIAAVSHTDSRFYNDGGFERERCDELYATWIENSCTGYADTVFVADLGKGAVAYLSCHLKTKDQGNIGLFAVDSSHQGMGIGRRLIKRAISWFREQGVTTIDVVTQGRNFQAQSIYQKCGFMTKSMELWFHYSPQPGIAYR